MKTVKTILTILKSSTILANATLVFLFVILPVLIIGSPLILLNKGKGLNNLTDGIFDALVVK